jgi:hypothetical protein
MSERVQPRSDRVRLPADVARCEPSQHCPMRSHCARYMAAIPAHGASMMDGSLDPFWTPAFCVYYISASQHLSPSASGPVPTRRHWDDEENS